MTTHPNCKINLGLHVTGRRANGYHTIETVFLPVPLCDRLTIEPAGLHLVLLKPPVAVSTAEAYRGIVPRSAATDLRQAVLGPPESWRETIVNDFEATVFEKHPSIAGLKQALYDSGAVYASMSGSGSALFGVFKELPAGQLPFEVYRG